jgi:predicted TIM-barrel enzyme
MLSGMANPIARVFGKPRVLLAVVHPLGETEALAAIRIAREGGADGIFLIDQGMTEHAVLDLVNRVRRDYPDQWIGLNLLSRSPADALATTLDACGRIDGIWSDNAGIDERATAQPKAEPFVEMRKRRAWSGLYFGGVAFKYQREVVPADLGKATALASGFMDVICTSGLGTGKAADPAKVVAMRGGVGPDVAISLASGVTPENVKTYLPHVDAYLVGTGIEHRVGVLDPAKVSALASAIHAW